MQSACGIWEGCVRRAMKGCQAIVPAGDRQAEDSEFSGQAQEASLISQGQGEGLTAERSSGAQPTSQGCAEEHMGAIIHVRKMPVNYTAPRRSYYCLSLTHFHSAKPSSSLQPWEVLPSQKHLSKNRFIPFLINYKERQHIF